VHLLGPRPFSQLPGYIAHFDVGLIPYVLNEFTMAVNPTKLREMLAAGCPVVSTNLPEVRAYRGHGVVVGDHAESFAAAVAKLSQNPLTHAERERISRGVANETWVAKVEELLSVLSSPL
jgi:glycosyltransferase involved in cell wall biosynthesis